MSVDPELAETDQPYAYASDDPVNEADPTGASSGRPHTSPMIDIGCGRTVGASYDQTIDIVLVFDCEEHNMTWELSLAPFVQPFVDGEWSESGMLWWNNGVARQPLVPTGHSRLPHQQFHGTLAPVSIGDYIEMLDYINYAISIGTVTDVVAPQFLLAKKGVSSFIMGPITGPRKDNAFLTAVPVTC
jgi:hypothetical protein